MNNFKKLSLDDKIGILLFLGSFIFLGVMVWACFKPSIWGDEAFSLLLVQKSYLDIINVTSVDVHPPLYYFILKFVVSLFQIFNSSPNFIISIAKFVSVIPFVLLTVLSFFKVRRNWGWLCCGVFSVCLTSMPQLMYYSVEIRMYSWALFFVTVCFIYACEVINESSIKNWVILMLSGVLAAYTHYFAAVSVIFIFLLLLIHFVFNNRSEIKKWLMAVLLSSLLYLPWLFVLIGQIMAVSESYWIEPITVNALFRYLSFIFLPSFTSSSNFSMSNPFMLIVGFLLVESYLILALFYFKANTGFSNFFVLGGLLTLILTVSLGVMVSILIKPIFMDRYLFPSLAVFWMTFAILLVQFWNYKKKLFVPILVILLLVSCMSSVTFVNSQVIEYDIYAGLDSFLSQDFTSNDVFFIDLSPKGTAHYYQIIEYPLKMYHNLNLGNDSTNDIFPKFKNFNDLLSDLNNNKTVWLFSSEDYDSILKNCTKENLTIEKQDSYQFELNNTCDLYKIS